MIARALALSAAAVCAVALAHPAIAAPACKDGVTATGRAANPMNYDPPKHYDAQKLATTRAIEAWSADVRARCGSRSPHWWRATGKSIECEGHAGGTGCTATATPAKKVF